MDIAEAKRQHEGLCLANGIDNNKTMLFGSVEDVEKEIKEAIEKGGKSGFMLASECEIPFKAPFENMKAIIRTVEKLAHH
jgi:uroporphyrinogen-III decarboxylase